MKHFFFSVLFIFSTFSTHADNFYTIRITADSEPLATVGGCVNALSGQYFWIEQDLVS